MRVVFADTGYWIALWDTKDARHQSAQAFTKRLGAVRIVTTQLVLVEVLNYMSRLGDYYRTRAAQLVQRMRDDSNVEIVPLTADQFWGAVERYGARADQTWSLTDCASFAVMEERGVTSALAHDRDFEQAGFTALLRQDEA